MTKRAKKAINVLNEYLLQLPGLKDKSECDTWKAKVTDSLILYLGADAIMTKRFEKLFFTDAVIKSYTGQAIGVYTDHVFNPNKKKIFEEFIKSAIHHVQQNGIKENYVYSNFLSSFSTAQILTGSLAIATLVFWLGWFVGITQKDREISKVEGERDLAVANNKFLNETLENSKKINAILKNSINQQKDNLLFSEEHNANKNKISNQK